MRMIDADALMEELGARYALLVTEYGYRDHYASGFGEAVDKAEAAPTIDAVPVVRCSECKHRGKPIENDYGVDVEFSWDSKCPFNCEDPWYSQRMADDFYCACGERRRDD